MRAVVVGHGDVLPSDRAVIRDDDFRADAGAPVVMGSIRERDLLEAVVAQPDGIEREIVEVMKPPMPVVELSEGLDSLVAALGGEDPAVMAAEAGRPVAVITRADLLTFFARRGAHLP